MANQRGSLEALLELGEGELWVKVVSFLSRGDAARVSRTCKLAYRVHKRKGLPLSATARRSGRERRWGIFSPGATWRHDGSIMWRSVWDPPMSSSQYGTERGGIDERVAEGDFCCERLNAVQWAIDEAGLPVDEWTCACVAFHGDALALRSLITRGAPATERVAAAAAAGGSQAALMELRDRGVPICSEIVMKSAARRGALRCLQWLMAGSLPTPGVVACAAEGGQLDVVDWLVGGTGTKWTDEAAWLAAEQGHKHVLEWALHRGLRGVLSAATSGSAAMNNHREITRWLLHSGGQEQGTIPSWHTSECPEEAALWLWRMGLCDGLPEQAAWTGEVEILKELHMDGAVEEVRRAAPSASVAGHDEVLAFLSRIGLLTDTSSLHETREE